MKPPTIPNVDQYVFSRVHHPRTDFKDLLEKALAIPWRDLDERLRLEAEKRYPLPTQEESYVKSGFLGTALWITNAALILVLFVLIGFNANDTDEARLVLFIFLAFLVLAIVRGINISSKNSDIKARFRRRIDEVKQNRKHYIKAARTELKRTTYQLLENINHAALHLADRHVGVAKEVSAEINRQAEAEKAEPAKVRQTSLDVLLAKKREALLDLETVANRQIVRSAHKVSEIEEKLVEAMLNSQTRARQFASSQNTIIRTKWHEAEDYFLGRKLND